MSKEISGVLHTAKLQIFNLDRCAACAETCDFGRIGPDDIELPIGQIICDNVSLAPMDLTYSILDGQIKISNGPNDTITSQNNRKEVWAFIKEHGHHFFPDLIASDPSLAEILASIHGLDSSNEEKNHAITELITKLPFLAMEIKI
ncbi:hypothetical protein GYA19_03205 [Candidatus Beckwithbacteria bacterium]|nr:hypothetical protein [Candidatus Beckwithbacteria bacterium]